MVGGTAACKRRKALLAVVEGVAVLVHVALQGSSFVTFIAPSLVEEGDEDNSQPGDVDDPGADDAGHHGDERGGMERGVWAGRVEETALE